MTDDLHCHVCQNCLYIWWHSSKDGDRRTIHLCPKCKSGPYYFGYISNFDALDEVHALIPNTPATADFEQQSPSTIDQAPNAHNQEYTGTPGEPVSFDLLYSYK